MRRILLPIFLLLVLPNIFFIFITYWSGDYRALINIDYLLPLLCFTFKNKIIKSCGIILFAAIFFIDILLIVLQHFPNLHFRDIFFLLSFTFSGPKIFIFYGCLILFILAIEILIAWFYTKKTSFLSLLIIGLCIIPVNAGYFFLNKDRYENLVFYNTPLASSNTFFYLKHQNLNFSNLSLLKPTPYEQATKPWTDAINANKPLNKKLLLIIVESWGQPLDNAIQEDILKNLKAQTDKLEYFTQGSIAFQGVTIEGELRELCQLQPETIDMLQIRTGLQNCLPHKLNNLGYETQSIHGSDFPMYRRQEWYPKTGIKTNLFQEDLNTSSTCVAFKGVCDWDILPVLKQSFAQDKKLFNYWLTLTSHQDYYEEDIHNKRFNCSSHGIAHNAACRNLMLQAQLFDYIADFIRSPEMQGVEVIIVGDHSPPLFKADEIEVFKTKQMKEAHIGWIHFKIKETSR